MAKIQKPQIPCAECWLYLSRTCYWIFHQNSILTTINFYQIQKPRISPRLFAVRTGLEPATSAVTGRHSNQLNYRTNFAYNLVNLMTYGTKRCKDNNCSHPSKFFLIFLLNKSKSLNLLILSYFRQLHTDKNSLYGNIANLFFKHVSSIFSIPLS